MKKLLSVALIFTLLLSCVNMGITFAVGENGGSSSTNIDMSTVFDEYNLLPEKDSTFESGTTSWSALGSGSIAVEANPSGEGKVMSFSGYSNASTYFSPKIDIRSIVQSEVKAAGYVYIYMEIYCTNTLTGGVRIRTNTANGYSKCTTDGKTYCSLGSVATTANVWSPIEVVMPITESDLTSTEPWNLCLDGIVTPANGAKIYFDNIFVGTVSPVSGAHTDIPEKTPITRSSYTKIGTLRWDAFSKSGIEGTPATQVAKVLSPKEYHNQAPFFANVNADGTVSFPEYTVETWEKEAQYAHDAGLDYFAYLWYETTSDMSQARKMHLLSDKKDLIEMTGVLETIRSITAMNEMFNAMKDSVWLRIDNRPVVFLYSLPEWDAASVKTLRQMAANAGVTESLYIIGMYTQYDDLDTAYAMDVDALSWYSYAAKMQGMPYSDYALAEEQLVEKMLTASSSKYDHQVVPCFSAGRDSRARIQTGVSWVDGDPNAENDIDKPYANRYSLQPTVGELRDHIATIYKLSEKYASKTQPNLICSYAWNEHEEGGWLCPTLECDEDGNVILDANGNPTANTDRLDAFKEVVDSLREESHVTKPTAAPDATKAFFNGNAEYGITNWGNIHAGSIGYVQPGANGTNNAVRLIPDTSSKYSSIAFDLGPAIVNDADYYYGGCGAGTYTVTFYAKAEAGYSGKFNVLLNSQCHLGANEVRNHLGYTEGDGNYANNTYFGATSGTQITMTDQWTKYTATFKISADWLNMMAKVRRSAHPRAAKAYNLSLRLDGSGTDMAYSAGEFFDYYIDEITITNSASAVPTPTPIPNNVAQSTPTPTPIPQNSVINYLEYKVNGEEVTITGSDRDIHGEVIIPSTIEGHPVTAIGKDAFEHAAKLTGITIPDTVKYIGDSAFERCFNLKKVNTPTSIEHMGRHAFCGCESLTGNIIIPSTMKSISQYSFYNCSSLKNANYHGTENNFKENVTVAGYNTALTNALTYTAGDIQGAVLNLGSTLTLDYYATFDVDINDVFMRFTSSSGRVTEVKGKYDSNYKMYKFSYEKINPQCMNDLITAELVHNDGSILAVKENYSVKLYCDRQMNKTAQELGYTSMQYEAFKKLLADMLVYGAEAQRYKEYRTDALADSSNWVKNYKSTFGAPIGTRIIEGNTDQNNKVKSLGLRMANVNNIYFKLILEDSTKIYLNDVEVSRTSLKKNSDGTYTLYSEDIKATDFDKVYTIKLVKNGSTVSTVSYNMYSYIQSKYQDAAVGAIVQALYNYGAQAKAYIKAVNNMDGDFDIGEEDDLLAPEAETISKANSTFEGITSASQTNWSTMGNTVTNSLRVEDGNQFLVSTYAENAAAYNTPMFNIMPYIKQEGAYTITFRFKVTTRGDVAETTLSNIIRTGGETSFSTAHGSNFYKGLSTMTAENGVWYTRSETIEVLEGDIGLGSYWNFGFHQVTVSELAEICIDDFKITGTTIEKEEPVTVSYAETWRSNEITLVSDTKYSDPYRMVNVDLILTNGEVTYTVPGFWDGGEIWRVRFMCPTAGQWTYTTVCTDTENSGLHNQTGNLTCVEYTGDLELYQRGHVKVEDNVKYFMYNDGTPFFYLADTHWNLGNETLEMVETIADNRVELGYSVIQSEPLGHKFFFRDGISMSDIPHLREYDEKFRIIADHGLTHVNASFFYPSEMTTFINNFGGFSETVVGTATHSTGEYEMYDISDSVKEELERACRYWVARYSSFPVMWSLGQEVDSDFFWNRTGFNGHEKWSYVNNPYHYVAEYISKYDPYDSPLTAHMEGQSSIGGVSGSSFRDMEEHDFFAMQWSPSLTNENNNHLYARDAWENGQGKPTVNYEGRYCYLWTKNFGARAQGWIAYLGGVYGYAWGGQDTWSYLNTYDENTTSNDGVDTITPAEKQAATWEDSLTYPSAIQVGYMRRFFEDTVGDWWNLIPRFDDKSYLTRATGAYANIASNEDNTKIVVYFFNFSDTSVGAKPNSTNYGTATGTLKNLEWFTNYKYVWFDPINNTYSAEGSLYSYFGSLTIPAKPAGTDYVLYVYK